jgi:NodT family efflux transporter outer membrane factor (OMF) lipoprotein
MIKPWHKTLPVIMILLSSCAVGPDYERPEVLKDSGVKDETFQVQLALVESLPEPVALGETQKFVRNSVQAEWWKSFESEKLNQLVEHALLSSPTLQAAQAKLEQAKQTYEAQTGSSLYPQVSLGAGGSRQRINKAAFGFSSNSSTYILYNAGLNLGYNFDLFGTNRRLLESLEAETEYQRYQFEAARLSLIANTVSAAMVAAQLSEQLLANQQILQVLEEQLDMTKQRFALGAVGESEVSTLESSVEQFRASIPQLKNGLAKQQHVLALLIGQAPNSHQVPQFTLADFTLPQELPVLIPSELLEQRPDILASEALLRSANAKYGLSVSRMYPQLNLSANIGSQALTTSGLFGAETLVWGLAGQLTQPLFNAGLPAESRAAKAGYEAVAANYRQTVLQAFQGVADVLSALDYDAQSLNAQAKAMQAAEKTTKLVEQAYEAGAASYAQVLASKQQLEQARVALIGAQTRRLIDTTALYQAMGGETFIRVDDKE